MPRLFLAAERGIEPVEDAEPFIRRSAGGEHTEPRFSVVPDDEDARVHNDPQGPMVADVLSPFLPRSPAEPCLRGL